jgi:hypothetical protein
MNWRAAISCLVAIHLIGVGFPSQISGIGLGASMARVKVRLLVGSFHWGGQAGLFGEYRGRPWSKPAVRVSLDCLSGFWGLNSGPGLVRLSPPGRRGKRGAVQVAEYRLDFRIGFGAGFSAASGGSVVRVPELPLGARASFWDVLFIPLLGGVSGLRADIFPVGV